MMFKDMNDNSRNLRMTVEIEWTDEQLEAAGLDPKKVLSIAKRLSKLSVEMRSMGLSVYATNGSGNLVHVSVGTHIDERGREAENRDSVICNVGGGFDGGDW